MSTSAADLTFHILGLCAARPGGADVADRLRRDIRALESWPALLDEAEDHGMEPLLRAHLAEAAVALPKHVADRLSLRWMQQAHACTVRTNVVAGVVDVLREAGIEPLILKGAALAHLVYPDPVLRPMRDVDLLVPRVDLAPALERLAACGFSAGGPPLPADHHHAPAMSTTVEGVTITIELHHGLFQPTPFLRQVAYEDVLARAQSFTWQERRVMTLSREDMLWHVYAHAFAINVTRPAIRLISVADLTILTERWHEAIDWDRMSAAYPRAVRALPLLHHLTPWSDAVRRRMQWDLSGPVRGVRRIAPRLAWSRDACRDVLWPPDWWLGVRYGVRDPLHKLRCRAWTHPAHLAASAVRSARMRFPALDRGSTIRHS